VADVSTTLLSLDPTAVCGLIFLRLLMSYFLGVDNMKTTTNKIATCIHAVVETIWSLGCNVVASTPQS